MEHKKLKKITLYHKEQRTIILLLVVFFLSGLKLPQIREQLSKATPNTCTNMIVEKGDSVIDDATDELQDTSNVVAEKTEADTSIVVAEKTEADTSNVVAKKTEADTPMSEEPTTDVASPPTTIDPKQPHIPVDDSKNVSPTRPMPEENKPHESTTSPSTTPVEKEWVQPVYRTIHHDAVYETKRVVSCNYCNEIFLTVGEFQIHKDANGG